MALHVGVTGSSESVTREQLDSFTRMILLIREIKPAGVTYFHHGDCVEGDAIAHSLVQEHAQPWRIIIHPPENEYKRAFCEGAWKVLPAKDYMARNEDIAAAVDVLLAMPDEPSPIIRSGTWATVRRARNRGKMRVIIRPDGSIKIAGGFKNLGSKF